ncbi:MAG: Ig-like domain-containing protein [Planctomycetota bacterium]|nr:Ig-like domain-containing protein [Planctomycetota bacterium]
MVVNSTPVGANDSYSTVEDTVLTVNVANGVLKNDTDAEGDSLTATVTQQPQRGTLEMNTNGSFVYTPAANFNGADSFQYRVSDGNSNSAPVTVNITIEAAPDAPVAVNDNYSITRGGVLTVAAVNGVLKNDTDADAQMLTASVVTDPQNGTVALSADRSFVYTPAGTFVGTDTFTYRANDGTLNSNVATVTVNVTAVNSAPVGVADTYSATEDTTLTVNAANGVLKNDTDADGQTLTATLVVEPQQGTVTLNADGSFSYTPTANYTGADSFTYRASDGAASSGVTSVAITVNAVNDLPVAANDNYSMNQGSTLNVAVADGVLKNDTDADGNSMTAVIVAQAQNGAVTLNPNGSFSYTPTATFSGVDTFTYRANDGTGNSGVATVTINVAAVNRLPVAANDSYNMNQGGTLNVAVADGVLKNDTDADGNTMTAVLVAQAQNGAVTLNPSGSFSYTPTATFVDTFTYRANDGTGNSNVATVTINVAAVNRAPVGVADTYSVNEDATLSVNAANGVLKNDTDADGQTLTASVVAQPQHGNVTLNADGSFSYTPTGNYHGPDSFTYRASDGVATSNVTTVSMTVVPVNDAPVGVADSYATNIGRTLVVPGVRGVLANDTDVDLGTLTAVIAVTAANGLVSLNPSGAFDYTPSIGFSGTDTFTYRVDDGASLSQPTTVTIQVNGANQLIAEQGSAAGTLIGTLSTTVTGSSKLFQINRSGLDPRLALAADDHISGNPASPVVLIEYLDYGCPACRAIHSVVKQMEQQFTGQLLVVRRHLPVVTANSPEAAWAAEAASLQGKFNEMTDLLFEKQNEWRFPSVPNPLPFFEVYAQTLGLNVTQFLFDYSAPAIANRVTRDQTAAVGLGANATPWFFLGPQHITTPTSATAFAAQIQAAVDSLTDVVTLDRLTGAIRVLKPSVFSSSDTPFEFTVNVANTTGNVQTIPVRITVTPAPVPANAAVPESESGSVSRQSLFVDDAFADDSWWPE